jgi:adenylate cyclase
VRRNDDYFGHDVNAAARITALADAGQAVITEPVGQVCTRLGLAPDPLGAQQLHNIATPVEVYTVALAAARYPTDPVCLVRVDPRTAASHLRRAGRDWWFCLSECAQRFAAAPAHYTGEEHSVARPAARGSA